MSIINYMKQIYESIKCHLFVREIHLAVRSSSTEPCKFREFWPPFPLGDIHKNPASQHVRACAAGDGAICSKNRKLSHVIGTVPILDMARDYDLRP